MFRSIRTALVRPASVPREVAERPATRGVFGPWRGVAVAVTLMAPVPTVTADIVHNDDTIIDGSLCVGPGCANGELFGEDTVRLEDTDIRIHFDDATFNPGFPANDWRLVVNDSTNGGLNHFSIEDVTGGTVPFRIEAGALDSALYVDSQGRVGLGTATPAAMLHLVSGNQASLRLEKDASIGQDPQTWELVGNDNAFFIIDRTNDRQPFTIDPGSPSSALNIDEGGGIGVGTPVPDINALHVRKTFPQGQEPALVLENSPTNTTVGNRIKWEIKVNGATGRMTFKNLNGITGPGGGPTTPFKFAPEAVENLLRVGAGATDLVDIAGNLEIRRKFGSTTEGGNLTVRGDLVVAGNCTEQDGACADYVFEEGYALRSLDELETYIDEQGHLPNVPSAEEMAANGVNMTHLSGRLLEKIEELTLYTLDQHDADARQRETIARLEARLSDVTAHHRRTIDALVERLDALERR